MVHRSRARRAPAIVLALLCLAAVAPAPASAQTDAALGCSYSITPVRPGAVGHANSVRVTIRDCLYDWDTLEVRMRDGASSTRTVGPAGFACDDGGFDVLCARAVRSTAGATLTLRPQCPNSARLSMTLAITDTTGRRRVGAPKALECKPPPVKVLRPAPRQSLATALRSGVATRFSCQTRCRAGVALLADTAAGETVGATVFTRTRAGRYAGLVRIRPAYRVRWRRRASVWVTVSVTITAASGEEVSRGHLVRLRR